MDHFLTEMDGSSQAASKLATYTACSGIKQASDGRQLDHIRTASSSKPASITTAAAIVLSKHIRRGHLDDAAVVHKRLIALA